jgi:hypothetical protein
MLFSYFVIKEIYSHQNITSGNSSPEPHWSLNWLRLFDLFNDQLILCDVSISVNIKLGDHSIDFMISGTGPHREESSLKLLFRNLTVVVLIPSLEKFFNFLVKGLGVCVNFGTNRLSWFGVVIVRLCGICGSSRISGGGRVSRLHGLSWFCGVCRLSWLSGSCRISWFYWLSRGSRISWFYWLSGSWISWFFRLSWWSRL